MITSRRWRIRWTYTRRLLQLAFPAMVQNLLQSMVGFVDTLFIAHLGLQQVAAVGVASALLNIAIAVFTAVGTAASIFVARYKGRGEPQEVRRFTVHSLFLSMLVGVLAGVIALVFAPQLLHLMGATSQVTAYGAVYFRIVAGLALVMTLEMTAGSILRAWGDTRTPMRVGLAVNAANIILDYILIFGFFFPGLGIAGAAWAAVLARLMGLGLLAWHLLQLGLLPDTWVDWRLQWQRLQQLVRFGGPAALDGLFKRSGQILYFGMIVRMGTGVYAAHTLAGRFTIFPAVAGTGLAVATATLVGQHLGRGRVKQSRRLALTGTVVSAVIMTAILIPLYATSPWTAHIFTGNARVIQLITIALGIDVLSQPATAAVATLTAALQAGGDTRFPAYLTGAGVWLVRITGVYLLGVVLGWGLAGVWIAIAIDDYVRAIILYWRFRSPYWIKSLSTSTVSEEG